MEKLGQSSSGWIRPLKQMKDLDKPNKVSWCQAQCYIPSPRGYEQNTNNSPKDLMHQGQRASEAARNSIKYSTCMLHIQLHPSFPCHKGSRLLRQSPSGQPLTLFPTETRVKVCMRLSSRTGVLFYTGWKNASYTQVRLLHALTQKLPLPCSMPELHARFALHSRHIIRTQWPGTRAHSAGQVPGQNSPTRPKSVGSSLQWIELSLGINISCKD